jgi:hypothetical protein
MDNTDPSFDSRLTGGVGLGFKVINSSNPYSFELMGQASGNGVLLFGGTDHAGVRYPWKSIWHTGNFDPADYQPAITGTENKVLSIQADGSGVKTGSISDNGTTGFFDNAFIGNSASTGIRHYHDVYLYSNPNSSETGILKIVMPQGWANTFQRITIKGYTHAGAQGAWECIIGGYDYNAVDEANDDWAVRSAEIRGSAPFSIVRIGYDGSKCVILLGTTETVWNYAKVAISDMLVGGAIYNWETGWSASIISSETGITNIAVPVTSIYGNHAAIPYTVSIGKTIPTDGYRLEVDGNVLVNGTLKPDGVYLDPSKVKAGTSQAGAGAVAGELWRNTSTGALHLGI